MKSITTIIMALFMASTAWAQGYKSDLTNNANSNVEIAFSAISIKVISHSDSEVRIERRELSDSEWNKRDLSEEMREVIAEREEMEEHMKEMAREMKGRAYEDEQREKRMEGLKPLSSSQQDNTGLGLNVSKTDNAIKIMRSTWLPGAGEYIIYVPDKATINYNDIFPDLGGTIQFEGHKGELVVTTLNSSLKMNNISGPVTATATNGSVEVVYDKINPEKPNTITSVNGFVDIALDANTKANLKVSAIQGDAFTDFDIVETGSGDETGMHMAMMDMVSIQGEINGGGQPITVSTVMGDIYIRKKK